MLPARLSWSPTQGRASFPFQRVVEALGLCRWRCWLVVVMAVSKWRAEAVPIARPSAQATETAAHTPGSAARTRHGPRERPSFSRRIWSLAAAGCHELPRPAEVHAARASSRFAAKTSSPWGWNNKELPSSLATTSKRARSALVGGHRCAPPPPGRRELARRRKWAFCAGEESATAVAGVSLKQPLARPCCRIAIAVAGGPRSGRASAIGSNSLGLPVHGAIGEVGIGGDHRQNSFPGALPLYAPSGRALPADPSAGAAGVRTGDGIASQSKGSWEVASKSSSGDRAKIERPCSRVDASRRLVDHVDGRFPGIVVPWRLPAKAYWASMIPVVAFQLGGGAVNAHRC